MNTRSQEADPRYHAERIKGMLDQVIQHVKGDVTKVDDPKAQALFETTAEVLNGLVTAYDHFENKQEKGWK